MGTVEWVTEKFGMKHYRWRERWMGNEMLCSFTQREVENIPIFIYTSHGTFSIHVDIKERKVLMINYYLALKDERFYIRYGRVFSTCLVVPPHLAVSLTMPVWVVPCNNHTKFKSNFLCIWIYLFSNSLNRKKKNRNKNSSFINVICWE